jgi:HK97 family phage major capsid protein
MPATDDLASRLQEKIDRANAFIEEIAEGARKAERDLTDTEATLVRDQLADLESYNQRQVEMKETMRIVRESRANSAAMAAETSRDRRDTGDRSFGKVEYRSAGQYVAEQYLAAMGDEPARQRLEVYNRAAAHQTTADNPGLLPESIVGPVVNFVDTARPLVAVVGPTDLGTGSWSYAKITQHTQVGVQSAEKTELASRKMTITKTAIAAETYGGYVNVSRQDINRTSPAILDMVINDLAGQYAIQTEAALATALTTASQTGPIIPTTPTGANIATAIWGAAGSVFAATKGQGRTVIALSPDQLGIIGPIFPNVNPTNAFSGGFQAGDIMSGQVGSLSGLAVVMSAGLATDTILVFSTAAVNCYESRYGALQVVEPSVWGVQVGYAGDFHPVVVESTAVIRVTTA